MGYQTSRLQVLAFGIITWTPTYIYSYHIYWTILIQLNLSIGDPQLVYILYRHDYVVRNSADFMIKCADFKVINNDEKTYLQEVNLSLWCKADLLLNSFRHLWAHIPENLAWTSWTSFPSVLQPWNFPDTIQRGCMCECKCLSLPGY